MWLRPVSPSAGEGDPLQKKATGQSRKGDPELGEKGQRERERGPIALHMSSLNPLMPTLSCGVSQGLRWERNPKVGWLAGRSGPLIPLWSNS